MNLLAANLIASLLSYVSAIMIAAWYVVPALRRRPIATSLSVLLWVNAFRYIALQIFSAAEVGGLDATTSTQRIIAFGDLTTAVLALLALVALRYSSSLGRPLAWAVAVVGTLDLASATAAGIRGHLADTASDWSWFVLAFYVPCLWVCAVLLVWQLVSRRSEPARG